MNPIIPEKRKDGGTSFLKLVSYISDRGEKPKDEDLITDRSKRDQSNSKKSVFDRLVDYVDRHDSEERAVFITEELMDGRQRLISGGVSCETNCFSWETAAAEMNMVAAQNSRCVDPVYHFILSWRENELPTDAQIFECATHSIRQLGLEGHQYVTAIHQDTDNTHCHVAVNRINPQTLKAANLWNDADTLQKACRVLERKYGFIQDNGSWEWGVNDQLIRVRNEFNKAPQGTVPLQVYSNTESLYHYAVDQVREPLAHMIDTGDISWRQIHLKLHERGLGLREQGQGLVVYDYLKPDGPVVKASSIHPGITKANLLPVLGSFEPTPPFETSDVEDGIFGMISTYQPTFELRDKDARFERRQERADARLDLKMRYRRYRESWQKPDLDIENRKRNLADHFRAMKATVRSSFKEPHLRKLMYRVCEFEQMKANAELRIQIRNERQELVDRGVARPLAYRAWVEQQALAGDVAAVSQLRGFSYREKRQARKHKGDGIIVCAPGDDSPTHDWKTHTTQIKRDGSIEYMRDGVIGVVDRGDHVAIKMPFEDYGSQANFDLAISLISHKSMERAIATGDQGFINQAMHTILQHNHEYPGSAVTLTDPEQRRYMQDLERYYANQNVHARAISESPDQPTPESSRYVRPE